VSLGPVLVVQDKCHSPGSLSPRIKETKGLGPRTKGGQNSSRTRPTAAWIWQSKPSRLSSYNFNNKALDPAVKDKAL